MKISTPNFELYTTAGEKPGVGIVQHFEQIRGFFRNASQGGARTRTERKVRLVAFSGEREYRPYQPNEFAAAYYLNRGDQEFIVMREAGPEVYRIAVHEYVHLLLLQPGAELPIWLNEGLAELYSTLKRDGNRTQVGGLIDSHLALLRQGQWLSLDVLTGAGRESPYYNEKARAGIFYAESWALAHMLNFREDYRAGFDAFLNRMMKGSAAGDAFQASFGKSAAEVENDLKQYTQGSRFMAVRMDVTLQKSAAKPLVEAAPEVELGLTLAELAGGGRSAEGKAALEKLAAAYPRQPEVAEALGFEEWRAGQREAALRHFERAIELGSRNARLHYECAGLSQEQGRPLDRVAELLEKAAVLDPNYREAWLRLGYTRFAQQRFGDALTAWTHATRVTHGEASPFFRSQAYARYRMGDKEEARRGAEQALEQARTPEDTQRAQELMRFLTEEARPAGIPSRPSGEQREQREPQAVLRKRPQLQSASGVFTQLECSATEARMHLASEGRKQVFLIDRPSAVAIKGVEGMFEFRCGPQKARNVVLDFETREVMPAGITGLVRVVEFK